MTVTTLELGKRYVPDADYSVSVAYVELLAVEPDPSGDVPAKLYYHDGETRYRCIEVADITERHTLAPDRPELKAVHNRLLVAAAPTLDGTAFYLNLAAETSIEPVVFAEVDRACNWKWWEDETPLTALERKKLFP